MNRREVALTFLFSIFLGGGLFLVLSGPGRFSLDRVRPAIAGPGGAGGADNSSPSSQGNSLPSSSQSENDQGQLIRIPLSEGAPRGDDIEDVLLLYSGEHSGNFDTNYCRLAEFLGLICKRINLDETRLTDEIFRDSEGKYFKLVAIWGDNLFRGRINQEEQDLLQSIIEHGGISLLISDINQYRDPSALRRLSGGVVDGFFMPDDLDRDWYVSSQAPEITMELSNQVFVSPSSAPQRDLALVIEDWENVTTLISSIDEQGISYPIFVKMDIGLGSLFIDGGELAQSFDDLPFREMFFKVFNFGKIAPLFITLKYVMGEEAWHRDQNYANLTLDALALRSDSSGLDYAGLAAAMEASDFHTTIGFIPRYWDSAEAEVVKILRANADRFSLVQAGNNADGYEFYKYSVSESDGNESWLYPRPIADQEADILEGLERMQKLRARTGIVDDRIMIFPQGISPEDTLVLLKKYNYLASVNSKHVPLDRDRPDNWDYGMYPAFMDYGNFPLSDRWHPGDYNPFIPDIQGFVLDLFLDKPALFFSRPDLLFESGIDAFNPVAELINGVETGVQWRSLGDIFRHLHLEKSNDDGSIDVQFYTNQFIMTNPHANTITYHVIKEETENLPIVELRVNGVSFPYEIRGGSLMLDLLVPSGETFEIVIQYADWDF